MYIQIEGNVKEKNGEESESFPPFLLSDENKNININNSSIVGVVGLLLLLI